MSCYAVLFSLFLLRKGDSKENAREAVARTKNTFEFETIMILQDEDNMEK